MAKRPRREESPTVLGRIIRGFPGFPPTLEHGVQALPGAGMEPRRNVGRWTLNVSFSHFYLCLRVSVVYPKNSREFVKFASNPLPHPVHPVHPVHVLWPFPFAKIRVNL